MSNCLIGYPDFLLGTSTYPTTLSNGSWSTNMPLNNIKILSLNKKARTTNAQATSTRFDVDLGTARPIRIIAFLRHNFSAAATVRVRGYSDASYSQLVWDSNTLNIWAEGYPLAENKKRYQEDFTIVISSDRTFRYGRVEIVDTANSYGYVEFARALFLPAFQPKLNMLRDGTSIGIITETIKSKSLGGVTYVDRREPTRIQRFSLELDEIEAFDNLFDMQWDRGIDREVMFVYNPEDTGKRLKQRSFLGSLNQLSLIEFPYQDRHTMGFEIEELL